MGTLRPRGGFGDACNPTPLNPENPKPFSESLRSLGFQGFEGCAAEVLQVRLRGFLGFRVGLEVVGLGLQVCSGLGVPNPQKPTPASPRVRTPPQTVQKKLSRMWE